MGKGMWSLMRMVGCVISFLLLFDFFLVSFADIRYTKIKNENLSFIFMDIFQFTKFGRIEINATLLDMSISKTSNLNLSTVGFFLSPRVKFLDSSEKTDTSKCFLDAPLSFENQNCMPELQLSMDVRSSIYNLDEKMSGRRSYLTASKTPLFVFYLILLFVYLLLAVVWFSTLFEKKLLLSGVFSAMLLAILSRPVYLLLGLLHMYEVNNTGDTQSLTVIFFSVLPGLFTGIAFLLVPVFIYSGWRKKLFERTIITLQIIVSICKFFIVNKGPCGLNCSTNVFSFQGLELFLMVVVCYCTRGWAARYFKWGSYVDGKAAVNLRKKKKIDSLTSGYQLWPEVHAQYIEVSEDVEKAAAQTLQDLRSDLWVAWEGD